MVLVYLSQVLPDNVYIVEQITFKNRRLLISRESCEQITDVIAQLYKNKLQLIKNTRINRKKLTWKYFCSQTPLSIGNG